MQKMLNLTARIVDFLSMLLVLSVLLVLLVGVFYRYVLHAPLFWSDMLAVNLFTWMLFLGTVISVRRGNMFKIEMLSSHFSPIGKKIHRCFIAAVCIFVYAFVGWYGWNLTVEQVKLQLFAFPQYFPFVNFAWIYISVPISFFLMILYELNNLCRFFTASGEDTA